MLFQHEDALILGMLFAKYFPAYVYAINKGKPFINDYNGGGGGRYPNPAPYGSGRGGVGWDPITNKYNLIFGDNGRPGASDAASVPADPSLSGYGGQIEMGGDGLRAGQLYFGGQGYQDGSLFYGNSAGGGAGFMGGGSSYLKAGGGGGSSWVFSDTPDGLLGIEKVLEVFPLWDIPTWLTEFPEWIGISNRKYLVDADDDYFKSNKELFTWHTPHKEEYRYYGLDSSLRTAFDAYCDLHAQAGNNGLILISKPNTKIEINKTNGTITGIEKIISYTGEMVEWCPVDDSEYTSGLTEAVFEFILWGACGGDSYYMRAGNVIDPAQSFTGGFGGAVGMFVKLPMYHDEQVENIIASVKTKLYMRVGQQGKASRSGRAFGGGGNGVVCLGGGGSTDIRFDDQGGYYGLYQNRLAVAGGGGGACGIDHDGPPVTPIDTGSTGDDNTYGSDEDNIELLNEEEQPVLFNVNDKSIVYVTLKYYTQAELPANVSNFCILYINNGHEGVLGKHFNINPVAGTVEIEFELDEVYPENTPTHYVSLTPEVRSNVMFVVPKGGVNIRVETRNGINEEYRPPVYPLPYKIVERLGLSDLVSIELYGEIEDIIISHADELELIDTVNSRLLDVIYLYKSVIDSLGLDDIARVKLEGELVDIIISRLEGLGLVDVEDYDLKNIILMMVSHLDVNELQSLVGYKIRSGSDTPDADNCDRLGLGEAVTLRLIDVTFVKCDKCEDLGLGDVCYIKLI